MANRAIMPMTAKWREEMLRPRGPQATPQPGDLAPEFTLPYAQYGRDSAGNETVEYGRTLSLRELRGRPVVLNLTRIVSDRFF